MYSGFASIYRLLFVDISRVHDFKDAKFNQSIEFFWLALTENCVQEGDVRADTDRVVSASVKHCQ